MPYTQITLGQMVTELAARLYDSGMVFWSQAELVQHIYDSLSLWNAMVAQNLAWYALPVSSTPWYDLQTITGSPRYCSATDQAIYSRLQYALLEQQQADAAVTTTQFSTQLLVQSVQSKRDEFLFKTNCTRTVAQQNVNPNVATLQLPEATIEVERGYWLPISSFPSPGSVVVAPTIPGETVSPLYSVTANGNVVPMYPAAVQAMTNPNTSITASTSGVSCFGSFSATSGVVNVVITCTSAPASAIVKPEYFGIAPIISGNTISFQIPVNGQFLIEVNGDETNSIQLYSNPPMSAPAPGANVTILPLGRTNSGEINLSAGHTYYIPDGAILYGTSTTTPLFDCNGANISILGYGIIDGSNAVGQNLIYAFKAPGLVINGPMFRAAGSFTIFPNETSGVTISWVKIVNALLNSDGIDISNCQNVNISYCYVRAFDDLIIMKTTTSSGLTTANVTVSNCVLWNSIAHALGIGTEINLGMSNILFKNCVVVRDKSRVTSLGFYVTGVGVVSGVTWQNIYLEECQMLFQGIVSSAQGSASNISMTGITAPNPSNTNVNVYGQTTNILIKGFSPANSVAGVALTGVYVGGLPLSGVTNGGNATGIAIAAGTEYAPIPPPPPGATYGVSNPLFRSDQFAKTSYQQGNSPVAFSTGLEPPLTMEIYPAPPVPGMVEYISVDSQPILAAAVPTILEIPQDFLPALSWGSLADILDSNSEARDEARAKYARMRFEHYCEIMSVYPLVAGARINGVDTFVGSVESLDIYNPYWRTPTANQATVAFAGQNLICYPSTTAQEITLLVNGNANLPATLATPVQLGKEVIDAILDLAQHEAMFKQGGAEINQSMGLYKNFIEIASQKNAKIRALSCFRDFLYGPTNQELFSPLEVADA